MKGVESFINMANYPITMKQINTKQDLKDFVKSIPDLREDFHEASDFLTAGVSGWILDNEGCKAELTLVLSNKNNRAVVNIATLLGMAYQ